MKSQKKIIVYHCEKRFANPIVGQSLLREQAEKCSHSNCKLFCISAPQGLFSNPIFYPCFYLSDFCVGLAASAAAPTADTVRGKVNNIISSLTMPYSARYCPEDNGKSAQLALHADESNHL